MSLNDCIKTLRDAQQISQDEADQLAARYQELESLGYDNAAIKDAISTELRGTKMHEKRVTLLQRAAEEDALSDAFAYRDEIGRQNPSEGLFYLLESFGEGAKKDVVHARDVIQKDAMRAIQMAIWEFRKGAFTGDKRRTGKWVGNAKVKARMENVIRELGGQNTDDDLAKTMAQAWRDTSEKLRQRFNAAGGDIGKLDDWIMGQWHDPQALLDAGMDTWVTYMMRKGVLDREKMTHPLSKTRMADAELRESLRYIWRQITSDGYFDKPDSTGAPRGKGALYKRRADHRFLHFKDADAWLKYQKDFGAGDPFASMIGHISSMSRDIAAMERFGPNPELGLQRIKERILKHAATSRSNMSILDELAEKLGMLRKKYSDIPTRAEEIMARIGSINKELEVIRQKRPAMVSKKNRKKRDKLHLELTDLHHEMGRILNGNSGPPSPEKIKIAKEIGEVMEDMQGVHGYPINVADPLAYAKQKVYRAEQMWKSIIGTSNTPVNSRWAGGMVGVRNWVSSSILTFASFSAIADQGTAVMRRAFIGMPVTQQFSSFLKAFTPADRKLALQLGIGLDQAANAFQAQARYINTINVRDWSGFLADRTHAFSLLSPMTQAAKIAFAIDFQSWMSRLRETAFDDLPYGTKLMFKRHDITLDDWSRMQSVVPQVEQRWGQEVDFLSPSAIEASVGRELAEKYLMMMLREQRKAVIEGTVRGRTLWISETQPGTIVGEGLRSISMLKSFPTSYATLILGDLYREIMAGRTQSAVAYGAGLIVIGSFFGALAKQAKNLGHGRDPEPMDSTDFWMKSFMQSGGAGIYGDFINSGVNRFGSGLSSTVAGPVFQRVGTARDLTLGNLVQYGTDEKTNFGREAVQFAREMTPGAVAPWYVRTWYERAVLDEIQKAVDPKAMRSFRQKQRRAKKLYRNEQWWPQGEPAPIRAPNIGAAIGLD